MLYYEVAKERDNTNFGCGKMLCCFKKASFRNRQAWKIGYREYLAPAESFQ